MPSPVGSLVVELAASTAKFQAELASATKIAQEHATKIEKSFDRAAETFKDLGKTILATFGISLSLEGVIRGIESISDEAIKGERALAQFEAVLKLTGNSVGLTAQQLDKLGKSIEESSIFSDVDIKKAETALLRFREIQGDTFAQALRLGPSVASIFGVDLVEAMTMLGRATIDPTRGLRIFREAGVKLSESQIDLAAHMRQTGDSAGAITIFLDEVARHVGNAGETDTKGLYGATKRLSRAWGDLLKVIGERTVLGVPLEEVTGILGGFKKAIDDADTSWAAFLHRLAHPGDALDAARRLRQIAVNPGIVASGQITGTLDQRRQELEAAVSATQAEIEARREANIHLEEASLKRREATSATYYQFTLDQTKYALAAQQAIQDDAYKYGETSTAAYYENQKRAALDAFSAQEKFLNAQIADQEKLFAFLNAHPSGTSEEEKRTLNAKYQATLNQIDQARFALGEKLLGLNIRQKDSIEKLGDEYEALSIKLLEASGASIEAARRQFDLSNKEFTRKARADVGSPDAAQAAAAQAALRTNEALKEQAILKARIADADHGLALTLGVLDVEQGRINVELESGALTELGALDKRSRANQALIPILREQLAVQEKLAESLQGPAKLDKLLQIEQLKLKIEELAAATDLVAKKFTDVFEGAFTSAFDKIIQGGSSARDIIKALEKDLVSAIGHIASQNISESLFGKGGAFGGVGEFFSKTLGFGGKGGDTGALALTGAGTVLTTAGTGLITAATALTAAAATLGASSVAQGASSAFAGSGGMFDIFAGLVGFAGGGSVAANQPILVGESGREAFIPRTAGTIIPNNVLRAGGRSGHSVVVTNNFTVAGNVDRATQAQIGAKAAAAIQRAVRKAG